MVIAALGRKPYMRAEITPFVKFGEKGGLAERAGWTG
jgi:hypothetical protein